MSWGVNGFSGRRRRPLPFSALEQKNARTQCSDFDWIMYPVHGKGGLECVRASVHACIPSRFGTVCARQGASPPLDARAWGPFVVEIEYQQQWQ